MLWPVLPFLFLNEIGFFSGSQIEGTVWKSQILHWSLQELVSF